MICGIADTCPASRPWIPGYSESGTHVFHDCKHSQCQQPRRKSPCGVRAVTHVYCTVPRSFGILYVPHRPTHYSRPINFPGLGRHRGHLPLRCHTHPGRNIRQSICPTVLARSHPSSAAGSWFQQDTPPIYPRPSRNMLPLTRPE